MEPFVTLALKVVGSGALPVYDGASSIQLFMRVRLSAVEYVGNLLVDETADVFEPSHRTSERDTLGNPLMIMLGVQCSDPYTPGRALAQFLLRALAA